MWNIIVNWLVMALAVLSTAYILPGVTVGGFVPALAVALVLGILNAFIRPILIVLTLPINILTLGFFTFVVNAILIMIAAALVPQFNIESFWWALLFSIILAVIMYILSLIF